MMAASLTGKDLSQFVYAVEQYNLPLAGRCLAEADPGQDEALRPLVEEMRAKLLARQRKGKRGIFETKRSNQILRRRIAAGLALGELGHPDLQPQPFSFEDKTIWAIVPPLQPVPEGAFFWAATPRIPKPTAMRSAPNAANTCPPFKSGAIPLLTRNTACSSKRAAIRTIAGGARPGGSGRAAARKRMLTPSRIGWIRVKFLRNRS